MAPCWSTPWNPENVTAKCLLKTAVHFDGILTVNDVIYPYFDTCWRYFDGHWRSHFSAATSGNLARTFDEGHVLNSKLLPWNLFSYSDFSEKGKSGQNLLVTTSTHTMLFGWCSRPPFDTYPNWFEGLAGLQCFLHTEGMAAKIGIISERRIQHIIRYYQNISDPIFGFELIWHCLTSCAYQAMLN
jgi:hypothetical protein